MITQLDNNIESTNRANNNLTVWTDLVNRYVTCSHNAHIGLISMSVCDTHVTYRKIMSKPA